MARWGRVGGVRGVKWRASVLVGKKAGKSGVAGGERCLDLLVFVAGVA